MSSSNPLNNDSKTDLLFKKFQGVAQTQMAAGNIPAQPYNNETKKSLTNVYQSQIFAENVPVDLSFTLQQMFVNNPPGGAIDISGCPFVEDSSFNGGNVRDQDLGFVDMSSNSFPNLSATGQLRFYKRVYLEPANTSKQSWYLIHPANVPASTDNNLLRNMIPWSYNDVNFTTYTPKVEYWSGSAWTLADQADANGLNWVIDSATGILQFYKDPTELAGFNITAGVGAATDASKGRPRISFIKYHGEFGAAGTGGGSGSGSGSGKITIGVSGESGTATYQDVSAIYFDSTDFSLNPLSASGEYIVTQVKKGFDLSGAFFEIPKAPTDGSYVKLNSNQNIRLNWTTPFQQQSALPFGPTLWYPPDSSSSTQTNINHLPYLRSVKIAYRDIATATSNEWIDCSLANPSQQIIPNTVIHALFGTDGSVVGDLSNATTNPSIAPYTAYFNNTLDTAGEYQFKIWYDNSGVEGYPSSNLMEPNDLSWNYLYIPDVSGEYIVFVGFGPAPPPTDLSFDAIAYNSFDISLSSTNTADASRNTPFPIPSNLSLRYKFGVTISGEIDSSSFQMPNHHAGATEGLGTIGYDLSGDFGLSGTKVFDYQQHIAQDISAAPQAKYVITKMFGVNNEFPGDLSYATPPVPPYLDFSMVTPYPERNEAIIDVSYRLPLADRTLVAGGWDATDTTTGNGITQTTAYPTSQQTGQGRKVYFITNNSNVQFKTKDTILVKMANNYAGPWPDASMIGVDSSGEPCSYIKLGVTNQGGSANPVDSSGAPTIGFLQDPSTSIPIGSLHYDFSSQAFEAGKTPTFQHQGYYTGLDVSNITISNVILANGYFPDICNNNYDAYDFSMVQYRYDGSAWQTDNSAVTWAFDLAKTPTTNTFYTNENYSNPSATLNNNFFGLKRPTLGANIPITYSYDVSGIWPWWKPSFVLTRSKFNFDPSPANTVSQFLGTWPITAVTHFPYNPSHALATTYYTNVEKYSMVPVSSWQPSNTQFSIETEISGNLILQPDSTASVLDISFGTAGKHLWWDYTWPGNNLATLNISTNSGFSNWNDLINTGLPASTASWYPINFPNASSSYNHAVAMQFNQMMWADSGFQGGYNAGPDASGHDVYRDFTLDFYNPSSALRNYSALGASGEQLNINYIVSGSNAMYDTSITPTNVQGTYKWIVLEQSNVTTSGPYFITVTGTIGTGTSTTLQLGKDYMMFLCEINSTYSTAGGFQYNGRSGWMDCAGRRSQTAIPGSVDGAFCWTGTVASGGPKSWWASPGNPSTLLFRIGVANSPGTGSTVRITGVTYST